MSRFRTGIVWKKTIISYIDDLWTELLKTLPGENDSGQDASLEACIDVTISKSIRKIGPLLSGVRPRLLEARVLPRIVCQGTLEDRDRENWWYWGHCCGHRGCHVEFVGRVYPTDIRVIFGYPDKRRMLRYPKNRDIPTLVGRLPRTNTHVACPYGVPSSRRISVSSAERFTAHRTPATRLWNTRTARPRRFTLGTVRRRRLSLDCICRFTITKPFPRPRGKVVLCKKTYGVRQVCIYRDDIFHFL